MFGKICLLLQSHKIVKLPKKNLKECKNWRGITLLSVVSKVMGKIVIDRIRTGVESSLEREKQVFGQVRELLRKFSY